MFVNIYKLHRPGVFYISITFKGFYKCMYWKKLLKEHIFHTVSHLFIWSFIYSYIMFIFWYPVGIYLLKVNNRNTQGVK